MLLGPPGAPAWAAVGAGLCPGPALWLPAGVPWSCPPAGELHLSKHGKNACAGSKAGNARGPSKRLRYSQVSES